MEKQFDGFSELVRSADHNVRKEGAGKPVGSYRPGFFRPADHVFERLKYALVVFLILSAACPCMVPAAPDGCVEGPAGVFLMDGAANMLANYGTIANVEVHDGMAVRVTSGHETIDNCGIQTHSAGFRRIEHGFGPVIGHRRCA